MNILECQFEKIETTKAEVSALLTDKIDEKTKQKFCTYFGSRHQPGNGMCKKTRTGHVNVFESPGK